MAVVLGLSIFYRDNVSRVSQSGRSCRQLFHYYGGTVVAFVVNNLEKRLEESTFRRHS